MKNSIVIKLSSKTLGTSFPKGTIVIDTHHSKFSCVGKGYSASANCDDFDIA